MSTMRDRVVARHVQAKSNHKFEDRQTDVADAEAMAQDLVDNLQNADVTLRRKAETISGALENAGQCETEEDLDANLKEAGTLTDDLAKDIKKALAMAKKDKDEEEIERLSEAQSVLRNLRDELNTIIPE